MRTSVGSWTTTVLAALLVVPGGVAAQSVDPSVVVDVPAVVRAAVAALVVGVVGVGFLTWRRETVDSAVGDTIDRPKVAIVYGLVAFAIVAFVALFVNNVLVQAGLLTTPLALLIVAIPAIGAAVVGGLGFLVVGTLLTGLNGPHRPRQGVLFAAILSALCWVAVPLLVSFIAWVLVAAFGVGGTTRTWVHSERTVAAKS
ncbi:hypothetical protein [Halobacterium bonnevillei]|uniref:Uncharacterized protein n=1 Tax=Halobacterium bonnevillei TaxID=2692200 RepID=A0A6B0SJI7_9EURY|nr:hypothetical protein [Halobacterium bonnevillei]MXR19683.1 hypothetical protein [Halobacterium bonnevillei]